MSEHVCDIEFGKTQIEIVSNTTHDDLDIDGEDFHYFSETGWIDVEKCIQFKTPMDKGT